ncbi:hypothetical protein [Streptomyces sp. L2]|uniref:hypothetical protein n=1 Tax=Streptomyces sp. L2 TaxID=2162665 RepID=UPI001F515697|nr:hypothetical protein [Streptomyces sp. L2]
MVDTMALLPAFLRSSRSVRRASRLAGRTSAEDEPVLDGADDRLSPALVAAGRGEYGPAAALLATTRSAREWEDRDRYARRLAAFARSRPEWFEEWGAADPGDPGLRLVAAQLAVDRAWPSPARAELLREVSPLITAAARAEDRDPVPWRIALDHARGSRAGHGYFGELWEAAVRRSPHHYGCHVAALRYLAASWRGSHRECFDFADRAAQDAPADSLVQALPVRAAFGYLTVGGGTEVPRARLDAATDRAAALSARLPAADPRAAETRNLLACVLVRLGRRREALVQLRLTGPYATSFPWERESDDPLGHFLRLREELAAADREEAAQGGGGPVPVPAAGPRGSVAADDH